MRPANTDTHGLTDSPFAARTEPISRRPDSLESDTSEHSYTLKDVRITSANPRAAEPVSDILQRRPSRDAAQPRRSFSIEIPLPAGRLGSADHRVALYARSELVPNISSTSEGLPPPLDPHSRTFSGVTRRASMDSVRLDIRPPAGMTVEDIEQADRIEGKVVRKRRRLPVPFVLFFGVTGVFCFCLGCVAVTLGSLNWQRISKSRAQKSVNDLDNEITPLIHAIFNATVGNINQTSGRMTHGLRRLFL